MAQQNETLVDWYIHTISQRRSTIRGNTKTPTLFKLQSWRRSLYSYCRLLQYPSWQHSSILFVTVALSVLPALRKNKLLNLNKLYTPTKSLEQYYIGFYLTGDF